MGCGCDELEGRAAGGDIGPGVPRDDIVRAGALLSDEFRLSILPLGGPLLLLLLMLLLLLLPRLCRLFPPPGPPLPMLPSLSC